MLTGQQEQVLYRSDVAVTAGPSLDIPISRLEVEPSLTLCDLSEFDAWGGSLGHEMFKSLAQITPFQFMSIRSLNDKTLEMRVTTHAVHLKAGQTPSSRREWHLDRIGGCENRDGVEVVDLTDSTEFPTFLCYSAFLPDQTETASQPDLDAISTQFLVAHFPGESEVQWDDAKQMSRDIDDFYSRHAKSIVVSAGDQNVAAFGPRTAHRTGVTTVPGWRFFIRVGLYSSGRNCSPYSDHLTRSNVVYDLAREQVLLVPAGTTEQTIAASQNGRSIDLKSGSIMALEHLIKSGLETNGGSPGESQEVVREAASTGLRKLAIR